MCESAEEIETLPPISIIHKQGSRVNRNRIVPHDYSRDHRPDCVLIVIALIVTPDGPLAYEVMPGNTNDSTTCPSTAPALLRAQPQ